MEIRNSRRMFVGGAVAGAALLGPLAWMRRRTDERTLTDGMTVVPGSTGATGTRTAAMAQPASAEIVAWQKAVGQPFQVSGPSGTFRAALARITPAPGGGKRPAGVRQQPFFLHFSFDRRSAPTVDGNYDIVHPAVGSIKAFLQVRTPHLDMASFLAVFD